MIAKPFSFLRLPFAAAVEHKWNMDECYLKISNSICKSI